MPNMSYCRFHNTKGDLDDCLNALQERDISSSSEAEKAKEMVEAFTYFLLEEGIIGDDVDRQIREGVEAIIAETEGGQEDDE